MDYKLGEMESRFADIIWANAPVASGRLVELCAAQLAWKKSTTYTMLKRLCEKGLFSNDGGTVNPMISREAFYTKQGEEIIADGFSGSLPRFVAAFASSNTLSDEDVDMLRKLIDSYTENER